MVSKLPDFGMNFTCGFLQPIPNENFTGYANLLLKNITLEPSSATKKYWLSIKI